MNEEWRRLNGFRVQVDGFRVVVAASLQKIYLRRSRPKELTLKFESMDEWLGIRD